jgi:hypothetical protein
VAKAAAIRVPSSAALHCALMHYISSALYIGIHCSLLPFRVKKTGSSFVIGVEWKSGPRWRQLGGALESLVMCRYVTRACCFLTAEPKHSSLDTLGNSACQLSKALPAQPPAMATCGASCASCGAGAKRNPAAPEA